AAGGVDHTPYTLAAGGTENVQRAGGTRQMRELGRLDAALDRSQRPDVIDHAHLGHRLHHRGGIREVADKDFGLGMDPGQVLTQPGAEIIEYPYAVATCR